MHPLNPYRDRRPDYRALSKLYPDELGPHVRDGAIDYRSADAARALTTVLLRNDFGVDWTMPRDRLCPPVPNRLNYICWLSELLALRAPTREPVRGIDIGTGASLIYPALGVSAMGWSFLATEIDEYSLQSARGIIERNSWHSRVDLRHVACKNASTGPLRAALRDDDGNFDFVMTNPPFFASIDELSPNPHTACAASAAELVTPGGEVAFVSALIRDSLALGSRVRWCVRPWSLGRTGARKRGEGAARWPTSQHNLRIRYTSMLGRRRSLKPLLRRLRDDGVQNVRTTRFIQGRTRRWALAWTFSTDGIEKLGSAETCVFGQRKRRRQQVSAVHSFDVPSDTASGNSAELLDRAREFFSWYPPLLISPAEPEADTDDAEWALSGTAIARRSQTSDSVNADSALLDDLVPAETLSEASSGASDAEEPHGRFSFRLSATRPADGVCRVSLEFTGGSDRAAFRSMCDCISGELARTNRRWRRKLRAGQGLIDGPSMTRVIAPEARVSSKSPGGSS